MLSQIKQDKSIRDCGQLLSMLICTEHAFESTLDEIASILKKFANALISNSDDEALAADVLNLSQ